MTDPTPPSWSDEDLSALLDGEAAPGVEARVAADPSAAHRLARLQEASRRLGQAPPPLPPATVDALIGAALDDAHGHQGGESAGTEADLGAPRRIDAPPAPRRSPAGGSRWLVAAVILVLLGTGLALVWSGRPGRHTGRETAAEQVATDAGSTEAASGTDAGRSAPEAAGGAGSAAEQAAPGGVAGGTASGDASPTTVASTLGSATGTTASAPVDLGPFADAEALRTAVATGIPAGAPPNTGSPTPMPSATSIDRCSGQLDQVLGRDYDLGGTATARAIATVGGTTVIVYELPVTGGDAAGSTLVAAVDPVACNPAFIIER